MALCYEWNRLAKIVGAAVLAVGMSACDDAGGADDPFEAAIAPTVTLPATPPTRLPYRERPAFDDIIYFVLPDRFENGDPSNDTAGISGGPLDHGYDPEAVNFYHGGDLKGLTDRLDYIKELGATAVWFTPVYKNKPVQGLFGSHSAGYHGYWVTDFTRVDPHLGSPEDFKAFVDAAHARDMKVILDIITNHTADVIKYRECSDPDWQGERLKGCVYRSRADYPYTLYRADPEKPINEGFLGDGPEHQTAENFAKLVRPDYAYTPFTDADEANIKVPAWLNDPIYYHNRGESTFQGENSVSGDFVGLDDVFTEHPRVVEGFIDIYKQWITDFRIDGFRVDTVKHVNGEFWQHFAPAILEHAKAEGIPHFYIFGEVYSADINVLSSFTNDYSLPAVLDFGFQDAVVKALTGKRGPDIFAELFANDSFYQNGENPELMLPSFTGNHDMGRFGYFLRNALPDMSDEEALARTTLGHGLMIFARGIPVIYYGDEQGFAGDGKDYDARENMFPSQVASYNDNDLVGTTATTETSNFDTSHPLYLTLKKFNALHQAEPALRRGKQTVLRADARPGILALKRQVLGATEYVAIVANTSLAPLSYELDSTGTVQSLVGACSGDGPMTLQAFELRVCKIKP